MRECLGNAGVEFRVGSVSFLEGNEGESGGSKKGTDKVFLDFLESGSEEDDCEWRDGGVLICRGYIWYLLNASGEEEEYIGIFGELLCGRI